MSLETPETPVVNTPTPSPTVTPTPTSTITPPPPAPPEVDVVKLSLAEHSKLQARIAELDRINAEIEQKRKDAEDRAIAKDVENQNTRGLMERLAAKEKAESERRDREYNERMAEFERKSSAETKRLADDNLRVQNELNAEKARAKQYAIEGEVARELAKYSLRDNSAQDAIALMNGQFLVEHHGNSFSVKSTTGQNVTDYVKAFLDARPHFLKADIKSGGSANSPSSAATTPQFQTTPEAPPQFRNLGEAAIAQMQTVQKAQGDARSNMGLGFGLKRIG